MDCARLMRGMQSMASTVALRSARMSMRALFWAGQKKLMRWPPRLSWRASSGVGGRTFKTRSASAQRVVASTSSAPSAV
jgi:hypothetical protein